MSGKRIRSSHQRRVLNWLLDGSGTVSEIAEALNLRMPHASLALRQLRERNEVSRDEQGSIRGAKHRLNEVGRARLNEDLLSRARQLATQRPEKAEGIVLAQDGAHVMLGYVKPPSSKLLLLPNQGIGAGGAPPLSSNGRRGGRWAVQRTKEILWYTLDDFEPTEFPQSLPARGTLTEWTEEVDRIGILRATFLDTSTEWPLSPGTWFIEPANQTPLPQTLTQGKYALGHATGTNILISPQSGVHGHLPVSVNRTIALNAMSKAALVFEDQSAKNASRTLPVNALRYWLRILHPRLSAEKLAAKFEELRAHLMDSSKQSLPVAVQRRIVSDFGKADWRDDEISRINFSGVSQDGGRVLLEWYLQEESMECVVEWPFSIVENKDLLNRLLSSRKCRILLTSEGEYHRLSSASSVLRTEKTLRQAVIQLGRGKQIPLSLLRTTSERSSLNTFEEIPSSALELLSSWDANEGFTRANFTSKTVQIEEQKAMWYALSTFPNGDENWANLNESTAPLAAWIATPSQHRTSRWIRLRSSLPLGWADLLPIEQCETATLISAMPKASLKWSDAALDKTRQRFINNVESIVKYDHFLQDREVGSWMATSVLLASNQLPEEFHSLLIQACSRWLDAPHQSLKVLEALFPIGSPLSSQIEECLLKCRMAAKLHPHDSTLYIWSTLLQRLESNEPLTPEFLRQVMTELPSSWWRAWAGEWLQIQLSSSSGRRWLASTEIPWAALLARPAGERGGIPALPTTYPDGRIALKDILNILLLEDGIGKPGLLDVHDMLATFERGESVHFGRTHPLVGWLARPVDSWPVMGLDVLHQGDAEIGALLYARSFASNLE